MIWCGSGSCVFGWCAESESNGEYVVQFSGFDWSGDLLFWCQRHSTSVYIIVMSWRVVVMVFVIACRISAYVCIGGVRFCLVCASFGVLIMSAQWFCMYWCSGLPMAYFNCFDAVWYVYGCVGVVCCVCCLVPMAVCFACFCIMYSSVFVMYGSCRFLS